MPIKRHWCQGGRHESDKQRRDDALMRKAQKTERVVAVEDKPIPYIDLGIENITKAIKDVTGNHDDAYQDAWVKVLEEKPQTLDDVTQIAKLALVKDNREFTKYGALSLDKPLKNDDGDGELTLLGTLPSKEELTDEEIDEEIDSCQPIVRSKGVKENIKGHVTLDWETVKKIKSMFPNEPLNTAIKHLAMLPISRNNKAWAMWEDAILRQRYPWGGRFAVAIDIHRSLKAIEQRAKKLGIQRNGTAYKLMPEWYREFEVKAIFGVALKPLRNWIELGYLKPISVTGHRAESKGDDLFFTPESVKEFMRDYSFAYNHESIAEDFKQYIPQNSEWVNVRDMAKKVGVDQTTLVKNIKQGLLSHKQGWNGGYYVKESEVTHWMEQPYKLIMGGGDESISHYILKVDEYKNSYPACRPHGKVYHYLSEIKGKRKFPTCALCLKLLGDYRKNNIIKKADDVFKPNECLICRQPQVKNGNLCEEHDAYMHRLYDTCMMCGRPTVERGKTYCEIHRPKPLVKKVYIKKPPKIKIQKVRVPPKIKIQKVRVPPKIKIQKVRVVTEKPLPSSLIKALRNLATKNHGKVVTKRMAQKCLDRINASL